MEEFGASPIKYFAYDINLSKSYSDLENLLDKVTFSREGLTKEEFLSRIRNGIEIFCEENGLEPFDLAIPLIIKYPAPNYHVHLALQLMSWDINKIHAFLDYQHENYLGLDEFQDIVEHGVYNWIKNNSPFDNNERLKIILEWVTKKRGVLNSKNKAARRVGDLILKKFYDSKCDVGEIVMRGSISPIARELNPPDKKIFDDVLIGMIFDGFLGFDVSKPNFFRLGQKGYDRLYQEDEKDYSAENILSSLPVVVILTAIKEEYLAIRSFLGDDIIDFKRDEVVYEEGIFTHAGRKIARVIIRECGAKNPNSSLETQRALTNFRPDCMLFVGIAGSRKPHDFKVGDVIFPEKVHYYEGGKSELGGLKPRPDDVRPTFALCEIAKLERLKGDWKAFIKEPVIGEVIADLGVLASGDQVVEHMESEIGKILTEHYGDSACVDMESYGFLNAIWRQGGDLGRVQAGIIRAMSDVISPSANGVAFDDQTLDRRPANAKKLAASTAAAFALWLVLKWSLGKN